MTRSINVAVIGAGYWGRKVVCEYLQLARNDPRVNLSMVCDLEDQNLAYCRDVFGIPSKSLTKDYSGVLESEDVHTAHICTPNETHYQICKDCLETGKHVLLEKPMTLNSRCAYDLVELSASAGLILQIGYIYRFNNAINKVRRLVTEGFFGDLYYLKLRWTTLLTPPPKRDIIFDLASHPVDILNYLTGEWPVKVFCTAGAYRRNNLEEVAHITSSFSNNLIAQIEISWLQPGKTRKMSIVGSKRCAVVDCLNQTIQVHENITEDLQDIKVSRNNTILTEVSHFARCIRDRKNPVNSGLIGARGVSVLECMRRSSDERRVLRVQ